MPLRIALVSREYPPLSGGGIGTYARNIAPALAARGCEVHVITQAYPGREPALSIDGRITMHRVAMGDGAADTALAGSIRAARSVARLARELRADVVEFPEYEAPGFAFLLARRIGALGRLDLPTVVHFHSPTEVNLALNTEAAHAAHGEKGALVTLERWCVRGADMLCAPSRFIAAWAATHYGFDETPRVIPYAIDQLPAPSRPPADGRPVLLYVGRLERRKGVDVLVRAWSRIAERHPEWTLRLVGADTGTGPGGASMRAHLESLLPETLTERTTFAGARPWWSLPEEYAKASACAVPSRWENFPNVCIEAMTCGRPVIAGDHGGMAEMLGDDGEAGAIFRAEDDDACAEAIDAVLARGPASLHAMGMVGRARISAMCDPRAVADARIRLYEDAIEAHARRSRARADEMLGLWRDAQRLCSGGPIDLRDPLAVGAGAGS